MARIKVIVEKTRTGYSAYSENFPVATTGKTIDKLKRNLLEALNLYFEDSGKTISAGNIALILDLPQFFEYYRVINAKALSERIDMNQSLLAQYISGIKKPSAQQTERILSGIRELGKELSHIHLHA